jgi:primase-polymerase (primpol)-like protein
VIGPPATVPLVMDGVPRELRAQPWIAWRWARAPGGGWRKAPFQIGLPDRKAANDRPEHWRNEGDVREVVALAPELFDGFGIVLTAAAGIAFIDLDHVIDPDTGAVAPWAMQMVTTFASFTEISCSGKGLHIFCRGQIPGGDGKVGSLDGALAHRIEVYSERRYAYLTGHPLGAPRPLAERQRLVTLLAAHVRPAETTGNARDTVTGVSRPDAPILEGQRNDALFRVARGFVRHGLRGAALEAALLAVSHRRCVPVPPDPDVVKIARHAERLPDRRPS